MTDPGTIGREAAGSQAAIEQRLLRLVQDFLGELGGQAAGRAVRLPSSLERDLGLGSLERVELLSRLEGEFSVALSDAATAEAETVGDLLRAVVTAEGRPAPQFVEPAAPPRAALPAPESAANLLAALRARVEADPQRPHVFLRQEDGSERAITYGELASRACCVAAELRRRGARAGDRVALLLPTGAEFFYSFLGILLAQAIPVPLYPPIRADRIEEFASRQTAILRNAEAALLITSERGETLGRLLRPAVPSLQGVVNAAGLAQGSGGWPAIPAGGDAPALIQYTSGSTGDPKGVLLTHASLLANIRAIGQALAVGPEDFGVSWLPLYHDMGLIGCWLLSLYFGMPLLVLSPLDFLSRPERWLWAIHSHRATLSVAPNFAYDLCARKLREESLEGLDLSCWRAAMNGAETVRPETIVRFTARFARYGFRPEAMLPVYGLAESTVALCFPPLGRRPLLDRIGRDAFERARRAAPAAHDADGGAALTFVSVGRPLAGHEVRIVDEEGRALAERVEGRIQFRGPSSMAGYFRRPEATSAVTFGEWLDSGDLGYWAGGELFITGRSKDIILKAGRNLYPHEIEAAVEEVSGLRKGCVAAFGTADAAQGTEKLVVAAETREQSEPARERLRRDVTQRVLDVLGVPADDVVLLDPGLLPKTSSGKLRRAAARLAYEQGTLGRRRPPASWQWVRLGAPWALCAVAGAAQAIGRFLYSVYFYALALALLLPCLLALAAAPAGPRSAAVFRFFMRVFLRLAGLRVHVEGIENLGPGPHMLVSNHASYTDPLALHAALSGYCCYVVKKELLAAPVAGRLMRKLGCLPVDRYSTAQGAAGAAQIERALAEGRSVLVFPEGTFTRARGLRPFKLGAFKAAAQAGRPIVPIAMRGTRYVLPDESWLPRRGPIRVIIRPPIQPAGKDWPELLRLRDAAFAEILAHCNEPRLDIASAAIPGRP